MTFSSTKSIILFACLLAAFVLKPSFSIAQPANDGCGAAELLESGSTCVNETHALRTATTPSTVTAGLTPTCGGAAGADVWFYFYAKSAHPTITLSGMDGSMDDAPRIQLFAAASCSLAELNSGSIACVAGTNVATLSLNTLTAIGGNGLTIGQRYLVRIFSTTAAPTGTVANWDFGICITDLPANDLCSNAATLTSAPTCVNTRDTLTGSNYTTIPTIGCGVATRNDVWYQFKAKSVNPIITITAVSGMANTRIQVFSGNCSGLVPLACGTTSLTTAGLTIGDIYFIRIYTDPNTTGIFDICVRDQASANDNCGSSVLLASGTSCVNTAGNMQASTLTALTIGIPNCEAGTVRYDVWYRFVAQTTNPTITLSSIGGGFAASAKMQLISWSGTACTTTATILYCGTTSIAANYLAVGTTYYVRVYSTAGTAPANGFDMNFNICVTDPVTPPPFNDNCANATNLSISSACDNFPGSMAAATLSSAAPGPSCGTPTYDVWYKFTAVNNSTDIVLSNLGTNFTNAYIQLLSGVCGSLTQVACGTTISNYASTAGTTYYVRVFSTTAGPAANGNANFDICVRGDNAPIRFGNSYVNISKKTTGGVVQTGDTLEIRMTINHKSGTLFNARYIDRIPSGTAMLTGLTDRIRIITNEGLMYKEYTLAGGDDGGTYLPSPLSTGQNNIRLNLALGGYATGVPAAGNTNEAASSVGRVLDTHNPRGGGGVLFAIAYRVEVTGATGTMITLNPGQFIYRTSVGGADVTLTASSLQILITTNQTLCSNSTGLNNALEDGGTFGNGSTLARATDLTNPIAGYTYVANPSNSVAIGDGRYSIVKNVSPRNSTNRGANQTPSCGVLANDDPANCNNRMYDHWVIDGDHTGTANSIGNTPPATGASGGYMLLVNADFVASEAYRQTINNLCPNTYYEFSAWIRNVCSTCGADSLGSQFTASNDVSRHGGVVGVYPNLSFAVDGVDRYSTGEVDVTGWEKRGFVFQTGPSQTSATFTIRNNSQGGGGNDWAMDDISVSTCLPTMRYSPRGVDSLCMNNLYEIGDTIRSVYNTYTYYRWQRKRNFESTWSDLTGDLIASPTLINGQYEFVTNWTLPPSETQFANNGDHYRVVVATTSTNLGDNACKFSDSSGVYNLRVMNCYDVLDVKLISFNGALNQGRAVLSWKTSTETEPISFLVEKSADGMNFQQIATVQGNKNLSAAVNHYTFNDSSLLRTKAYFRIALINGAGKRVQSNTILLNGSAEDFTVANVINPFSKLISLDVTTGTASRIDIALLDGAGQLLLKKSYNVQAGVNNLVIPDVSVLANGVYFIQVQNNGKTISKKVIKR